MTVARHAFVFCFSGDNPAIRHISRTEGIIIQILHKPMSVASPDCPCARVTTDFANMAADIDTKGVMNLDECVPVCRDSSMFYFCDLEEVFTIHVEYLKQQDAVKSSALNKSRFRFVSSSNQCSIV